MTGVVSGLPLSGSMGRLIFLRTTFTPTQLRSRLELFSDSFEFISSLEQSMGPSAGPQKDAALRAQAEKDFDTFSRPMARTQMDAV